MGAHCQEVPSPLCRLQTHEHDIVKMYASDASDRQTDRHRHRTQTQTQTEGEGDHCGSREREKESCFLVLVGCKSGTLVCLKLLLYSD